MRMGDSFEWIYLFSGAATSRDSGGRGGAISRAGEGGFSNRRQGRTAPYPSLRSQCLGLSEAFDDAWPPALPHGAKQAARNG